MRTGRKLPPSDLPTGVSVPVLQLRQPDLSEESNHDRLVWALPAREFNSLD
jgi:hypothetical protein